jgi:hypothetical protein
MVTTIRHLENRKAKESEIAEAKAKMHEIKMLRQAQAQPVNKVVKEVTVKLYKDESKIGKVEKYQSAVINNTKTKRVVTSADVVAEHRANQEFNLFCF